MDIMKSGPQTTDQAGKTSSEWIEQIERACSDLPIADIRERLCRGGLFLLMDEIMRKKSDA
jgi:hypothetical protein